MYSRHSPSAHIYDVGQWGCLKLFSSQVVNATYASQIKLAKNKTANNGIESTHRSSTLEVCTGPLFSACPVAILEKLGPSLPGTLKMGRPIVSVVYFTSGRSPGRKWENT